MINHLWTSCKNVMLYKGIKHSHAFNHICQLETSFVVNWTDLGTFANLSYYETKSDLLPSKIKKSLKIPVLNVSDIVN